MAGRPAGPHHQAVLDAGGFPHTFRDGQVVITIPRAEVIDGEWWLYGVTATHYGRPVPMDTEEVIANPPGAPDGQALLHVHRMLSSIVRARAGR